MKLSIILYLMSIASSILILMYINDINLLPIFRVFVAFIPFAIIVASFIINYQEEREEKIVNDDKQV